MLQTVFSVVLIVLSALLIGAILLQARGAGLGAAFGGEGNVFRTKRGVERVLFRATIVISILFFGTALASAVLS
ncbi:preprotein translocase subunit SecG [Patescibacteria group bacterium]|nr:MAG: preprotein translocase subunit SecG [Patescibacteria group bacterium]